MLCGALTVLNSVRRPQSPMTGLGMSQHCLRRKLVDKFELFVKYLHPFTKSLFRHVAAVFH
jgi:DNA-directed RNA polymerase subunit N (RpoN/RPB10)